MERAPKPVENNEEGEVPYPIDAEQPVVIETRPIKRRRRASSSIAGGGDGSVPEIPETASGIETAEVVNLDVERKRRTSRRRTEKPIEAEPPIGTDAHTAVEVSEIETLRAKLKHLDALRTTPDKGMSSGNELMGANLGEMKGRLEQLEAEQELQKILGEEAELQAKLSELGERRGQLEGILSKSKDDRVGVEAEIIPEPISTTQFERAPRRNTKRGLEALKGYQMLEADKNGTMRVSTPKGVDNVDSGYRMRVPDENGKLQEQKGIDTIESDYRSPVTRSEERERRRASKRGLAAVESEYKMNVPEEPPLPPERPKGFLARLLGL